MRMMLFSCILWPNSYLRMDNQAWYLVPRDQKALSRVPLVCPDQDMARNIDKEMMGAGPAVDGFFRDTYSMPTTARAWTPEELRCMGVRFWLPGEGPVKELGTWR